MCRPYRLGEHIKYYELDRPSTVQSKHELINKINPIQHNKDTVEYHNNIIKYIPVNLNTDEWINELYVHEFDRSKNTIIMAEGLLYYLNTTAVHNIISSIHTLVNNNVNIHFLFDAIPECVISDPTHSCKNKYNGYGIQQMLHIVKTKGEPASDML